MSFKKYKSLSEFLSTFELVELDQKINSLILERKKKLLYLRIQKKYRPPANGKVTKKLSNQQDLLEARHTISQILTYKRSLELKTRKEKNLKHSGFLNP